MLTHNVSKIENKLRQLVKNIAIPDSKYEEAKNNDYRFFSFGDAMFIY